MSTNSNIFDQPDQCRTVAFEVENRKFWVPKEALAMYSDVFKAMFYGDFVESTQQIVPLPGKKAEDIEEMLLCLIPTPNMKPIDDSNMESMLALADEYQISDLRGRVESHMMSTMKNCENGDKFLLIILRMAAKHHSKLIFESCIKRCASEFDMEVLEACADLPKAIINCVFLCQQMDPLATSLASPWEKLRRRGGNCEVCSGQLFWASWRCTYCSCISCYSCADKAHHSCQDKKKAEAAIKRMKDTIKTLLGSI